MTIREARLVQENPYLGTSMENLFMLSQESNNFTQKDSQPAIRFTNVVIATAISSRYLGEAEFSTVS